MPPKPLANLGFRSSARMAFYILLILVFYLTVKPNPAIQEIGWMPDKTAAFFDLHDGWKNAVGYGMLALTGFVGWHRISSPPRPKLWRRMLLQALGLWAIVVAMELLQLFIPTRFCDIKDMTAGSFGVGVAWLIAALGEGCEKLARQRKLGSPTA